MVQVGMKEEEKGRNEKGRQNKEKHKGRGPGLKRGDVATEGLPTDSRKHTSTGLVPRKERICCLGSRTCVTKLDPPVLLISLRSEVMFVFQNRQCHFRAFAYLFRNAEVTNSLEGGDAEASRRERNGARKAAMVYLVLFEWWKALLKWNHGCGWDLMSRQ